MFRCLEFGHTFVRVEEEDDTDSIEVDDLICPDCGSGIERVAYNRDWDVQCPKCLAPAKETFSDPGGVFATYKCRNGHEFDNGEVAEAEFRNSDYMRNMNK